MAVLPEAMVELGPQRGVRLSEEKISSKGCFFLGSFIYSIGKTLVITSFDIFGGLQRGVTWIIQH